MKVTHLSKKSMKHYLVASGCCCCSCCCSCCVTVNGK